MYCVIKTVTNVGSTTEATGVTKVHAYYCHTKKLAGAYVRKKFEERSATILKKSKEKHSTVEFRDCGIRGDNTWSNITYVDKNLLGETGYECTMEEMMVIRGKEILDLPNGPTLKVE